MNSETEKRDFRQGIIENRWALITNAIFAALILISTICFISIKNISPYIFKTISSSLFVGCAVFNVIYSMIIFKPRGIKAGFVFTMLAGLFLAFLGDVLIIDSFVLGAIFFAAAHLAFFAAMIVLNGFNVKDAIFGLLVFVVAYLIINFVPVFDFGGFLVLIDAYALIISIMLGKAISNCLIINNRWVNLLIMLGALMFFFSNVMLVFYLFAGKRLIFDVLCLSTYYPAEFVLAFSIFVVSRNFVAYRPKGKINNKIEHKKNKAD